MRIRWRGSAAFWIAAVLSVCAALSGISRADADAALRNVAFEWRERLPVIARGHGELIRYYEGLRKAGREVPRLAFARSVKDAAQDLSARLQAFLDGPSPDNRAAARAGVGRYCGALRDAVKPGEFVFVPVLEIATIGSADARFAKVAAFLLPNEPKAKPCQGFREPGQFAPGDDPVRVYRALSKDWQDFTATLEAGLSSARDRWSKSENATKRAQLLASLERQAELTSTAFALFEQSLGNAEEFYLLERLQGLCALADAIEREGGPFASVSLPWQIYSLLPLIRKFGEILEDTGRRIECPREPY